jgi:hypothetical protein
MFVLYFLTCGLVLALAAACFFGIGGMAAPLVFSALAAAGMHST